MKKLLVLILFLFAGTISIAGSNYKTISLPKGVSIDLPINWQVMSNNERITLDAYAETLSDPPIDSEFPFAANYYNDNDEIDALMNIRYYPREVVTQENVINMFTPDVLREMDDVLYKSSTLAMKKISGKMLSWNGTKKKLIKDTVALVTEYRRYSGLSKSNARVRLVRVLNGNKSFTLTVSYADNKKSSSMLERITNRIIESLSLSN